MAHTCAAVHTHVQTSRVLRTTCTMQTGERVLPNRQSVPNKTKQQPTPCYAQKNRHSFSCRPPPLAQQKTPPSTESQVSTPAWHQVFAAVLSRVLHVTDAPALVALAIHTRPLAGQLRTHHAPLRTPQHARGEPTTRQRLGQVNALACRTGTGTGTEAGIGDRGQGAGYRRQGQRTGDRGQGQGTEAGGRGQGAATGAERPAKQQDTHTVSAMLHQHATEQGGESHITRQQQRVLPADLLLVSHKSAGTLPAQTPPWQPIPWPTPILAQHSTAQPT